jgi:low temperature requirement protein LtrA
MLAVSGNNMLASAQQRLDKVLRRRRPPPGRAPVTIQAAHTEAAHLAERMGLFVIIVLGEGVIQVITTAADFSVWNFPLDAVALGAFGILVGLWTLSLRYGFAGVPGLESSAIPTRFALTLHCVTTGALAALAAGLGEAVAHTGETLPDQTRWLLCGGIAAYFVISTIGGIIAGTTRSWLFGTLPCLIGSVVLGAFGREVRTGWVVWLLVAVVVWQIRWLPITERRTRTPAE